MWLILLVAGLVFAFSINDWQITPLGLMIAASVVLVSWWMSPFSGGKSPKHDEVTSLPPEERGVVIYWRPGCIFCQRLKGGLGSDGKKATWINIWQDADAAEYVRSVNDGNEVVPTVVIDGEPHTNPDPRFVRDVL